MVREKGTPKRRKTFDGTTGGDAYVYIDGELHGNVGSRMNSAQTNSNSSFEKFCALPAIQASQAIASGAEISVEYYEIGNGDGFDMLSPPPVATISKNEAEIAIIEQCNPFGFRVVCHNSIERDVREWYRTQYTADDTTVPDCSATSTVMNIILSRMEPPGGRLPPTLELFRAPEIGLGVRTWEAISASAFICPYIGRVRVLPQCKGDKLTYAFRLGTV